MLRDKNRWFYVALILIIKIEIDVCNIKTLLLICMEYFLVLFSYGL